MFRVFLNYFQPRLLKSSNPKKETSKEPISKRFGIKKTYFGFSNPDPMNAGNYCWDSEVSFLSTNGLIEESAFQWLPQQQKKLKKNRGETHDGKKMSGRYPATHISFQKTRHSFKEWSQTHNKEDQINTWRDQVKGKSQTIQNSLVWFSNEKIF